MNMKFDVQYECIDKECNTIVLGKGRTMDGARCPRCNGPVFTKLFEEHKRMASAVYQCLCCEHKDKVQTTKEDYREVLVCPKCNGAFVDLYHIGKYPKKKDDSLDLKQLIGKRILTVNEVRKHYRLQPIPMVNIIY